MSDRKINDAEQAMEPLTRMELAISYVLRIGVLLSAAVILTGILLLDARHDTGYAQVSSSQLKDLLTFHQSSGPGYFPTSFQGVFDGARAGKPYAIIGVGILLLIATPIIRVALSVFFFIAQGDRLYVAITLFVLIVLLISLFAGIG